MRGTFKVNDIKSNLTETSWSMQKAGPCFSGQLNTSRGTTVSPNLNQWGSTKKEIMESGFIFPLKLCEKTLPTATCLFIIT